MRLRLAESLAEDPIEQVVHPAGDRFPGDWPRRRDGRARAESAELLQVRPQSVNCGASAAEKRPRGGLDAVVASDDEISGRCDVVEKDLQVRREVLQANGLAHDG